MNPIEEYLANHGVRVKQFAEQSGYSKESIYKFIRGERKPRRHSYKKLCEASGNTITVQQLKQYFEGGTC